MTRGQEIYQRTLGKYLGKKGVVITPGYLRLESAALGTQNTIDFGTLTNENAPGATAVNVAEQRLNMTDNFYVSEIGIYIMKVTTAGETHKGIMRTYLNSLIFSGSNEALNLRNLYNGKLLVDVNGDRIIDGWDVMRHYRVGNAQEDVLTAASGTGNAWEADTWDTASFGMFPCTPGFELQGNAKNKISISCPAALNMAGTSSSNYAIFIARGLKIQNGSKLA